MPNESTRVRRSFHQPLLSLRAGARQMRSSAFCSSPKTVEAPVTSSAVPTIMASTPLCGLRALATSPSMARAPSAPTSAESCPKISPRAASSPKKKPATPMTIRSSGAIENSA